MRNGSSIEIPDAVILVACTLVACALLLGHVSASTAARGDAGAKDFKLCAFHGNPRPLHGPSLSIRMLQENIAREVSELKEIRSGDWDVTISLCGGDGNGWKSYVPCVKIRYGGI